MRSSGKLKVNSPTEETAFSATRRQVGLFGLIAGIAGVAQPATAAAQSGLSFTGAKIATKSVTANVPAAASRASLFHQAGSKNRGLVVWGTGDARSKDAARELAAQGWTVLLANCQGLTELEILRATKAYVAWLESQEEVISTGLNAKSASGNVGYGYKLQSISAALPRLSLASRSERESAARSAILVAVPDGFVPSYRKDGLRQSARIVHRSMANAVAA